MQFDCTGRSDATEVYCLKTSAHCQLELEQKITNCPLLKHIISITSFSQILPLALHAFLGFCIHDLTLHVTSLTLCAHIVRKIINHLWCRTKKNQYRLTCFQKSPSIHCRNKNYLAQINNGACIVGNITFKKVGFSTA